MKRLAGAFSSTSSGSRSLSRSSRVRTGLEDAAARLIGAVAVGLAILFAAPSVEWAQRDPSVSSIQSVVPQGTTAVLHSASSHKLAIESRSPNRSANGFDAALPEFVRANADSEAARGAGAVAPAVATASIVSRGYDATAPPALS